MTSSIGAELEARRPAHIPAWFGFLSRWPRKESVMDRLIVLGFWDLPTHCDWYANGRWTWRWWRGSMRADRECEKSLLENTGDFELVRSFRDVTDNWRRHNRFQAFGWWIERRIIVPWCRTMPRWR